MRLAALVLALATQLAAADFLALRRSGNVFVIQTNEGIAELEWITGATFRYYRSLQPNPGKRLGRDPVVLTVNDAEDRLEMKSNHLTVTVFKQGMRLQVDDADKKMLATFADNALEHEFDLRKNSYLFNKAGYGLGTDRKGDCFFYYGPTPKEALEQRAGTVDRLPQFDRKDLKLLTPADLPRQATRLRAGGEGSWESLAAVVKELVQESLEAVLLPAFNLGSFGTAPEPVRKRAQQLASFVPFVYAQPPAPAGPLQMRSKLASHFMTYFWEGRERGFPLIHPLAMQYPADPLAVAEESVFLLGDELLVVPIVSPSSTRSFYLPQGIWTELATNQKYRGRQKIEIPVSDHLPVFLRNGSILPLDGDPMTLHYTPSLGAEYFLYEPDLDDYSQMHAAPSLDWLRLEIESKKTRNYEWIVHHVERPKAVDAAARWSWDRKTGNLHVSVNAQAGSDVIVNIRY
jgi:hypothetical protein